jgi:hypothetical protein
VSVDTTRPRSPCSQRGQVVPRSWQHPGPITVASDTRAPRAGETAVSHTQVSTAASRSSSPCLTGPRASRAGPRLRGVDASGVSSRRWAWELSVVGNVEAELAEAIRFRDHVDLGDLVGCDREAEYQEQPSVGGHQESDRSVFSAGPVDQARSMAAIALLATVWAPRMTMGAGVGTTALSARSTTPGSSNATSASKSPPRVAARNASTLAGQIGVGHWVDSFDPTAGAARELSGRGRGSLDHRGDLLEGQGAPPFRWFPPRCTATAGEVTPWGRRVRPGCRADRCPGPRFRQGLRRVRRASSRTTVDVTESGLETEEPVPLGPDRREWRRSSCDLPGPDSDIDACTSPRAC